mgnify:CR=1 FL=1
MSSGATRDTRSMTRSHAGDNAAASANAWAWSSPLAFCFIDVNLSKTFLSGASEHTSGFGGGICAQYELYIFTNPSRVCSPSCFLPVVLKGGGIGDVGGAASGELERTVRGIQ